MNARRRAGGVYHLSTNSASTYVAGVERHEVVEPLADADVADRQLQVVRDRDGDAALGRAVELRQHDAVGAARRHELARLHEAVLADGRVEHEQHFVRRARHVAADDAADLVELGHEIRARVQPAGGVDDDDVAAARLGRR